MRRPRFDDEAVLVLSELDPALNQSANPAAFDMRNFKPTYRLINGRAYPATSPIATAPGNRVLLRYVNAGQQQHSMTLLGTQQVLVGKDGNFLTHFGKRVAETIAPGETLDAIVTIPAGAAPGSKFALFDGSLMLVNGNAPGFGGMLTFLQAGNPGGGGPDVIGPVAQLVTVSAIVAGNVTLSAAISDAASGGSNVAAAEYRIDTGATATTMAATDGSFDSPQEAVNATVPVGGLSSGSHTLYVRGQDAAGNWGNWGATVLSIDTAGPTTYGLVANPATSSGTVNVALTGSASDAATGGSSIAGAEYFLDAQGATGSGAAMTVSPGAPSIASLTATIPAATVAALAEGSHPVHVHARDALGNWGPFPATPLALIVDRTGPPAPNPVAANPPATNGSTGFNSSTPAIRVTITATDALSTVAGAEAFVDTPGASGTGFQFAPSDGSWNGTTENAYGDIPLSHVNLLPTGTHTIYVHARDAAGNWGANATTTLLVDKTAPTLTSITLSPTTAIVGENVTLTANGASDATSGIGGGQYWFDTATPPAFPSSFTGTTATISSATGGGPHRLRPCARRRRQLEPGPERDAHRAERGERHPHAHRERGRHADEQPGRARRPRERPADRDGRTHGQARHRAGSPHRNGRRDRHAGLPGHPGHRRPLGRWEHHLHEWCVPDAAQRRRGQQPDPGGLEARDVPVHLHRDPERQDDAAGHGHHHRQLGERHASRLCERWKGEAPGVGGRPGPLRPGRRRDLPARYRPRGRPGGGAHARPRGLPFRRAPWRRSTGSASTRSR